MAAGHVGEAAVALDMLRLRLIPREAVVGKELLAAVVAAMARGQYLWHVGPPTVRARSDGSVEALLFFGDSVADEWVAVGKAHEAAAAVPGTLVVAEDSDGLIYLIEAALHLPDGLDPDTAAHRVFWADGELRILPLAPVSPAQIGLVPVGAPTSEDEGASRMHALLAAANLEPVTRAPRAATAALHARIAKAEREAQSAEFEVCVNAQVALPAAVALAAARQQGADVNQLAQAALLAASLVSPPASSATVPSKTPKWPAALAQAIDDAESQVWLSLRVSKLNYASLASHATDDGRPRDVAGVADVLGPALSSGLATVLHEYGVEEASEAVADSPRWRSFLTILTRSGYFTDPNSGAPWIQGSEGWRSQMAAAKAAFEVAPQAGGPGTDRPCALQWVRARLTESARLISASVASLVDDGAVGELVAQLKAVDLASLPSPSSDSWLYLEPPELERYLAGELKAYAAFDAAQGEGGSEPLGDENEMANESLADEMATRVRAFVESSGGPDGAEADAGRHSLADIEAEPRVEVDAVALRTALRDALSMESGRDDAAVAASMEAMDAELAGEDELGRGEVHGVLGAVGDGAGGVAQVAALLESYGEAMATTGGSGPAGSLLRALGLERVLDAGS
ncbi:uncharacterized protein AMSG_00131 [Thecamonas trahens ATCC 50062]|uniref:Uncharacterized protein n=1 Tax=Thecamonas trahens ATCC 50062 TaxID=461836 RepID=A0A0L0D3X9_THETB|nr:hypothetical protein AMSG_00131 [Thecamonas trahens ATCC 50062]KNC46013.1 hypothetical protein AMSG_00131 [Thecamonas trahens ATCC 50062]|eukprot:XP_013762993.1 hypothetical protein AMSG_00131 [Thecamonas trahens ATCC 50062]